MWGGHVPEKARVRCVACDRSLWHIGDVCPNGVFLGPWFGPAPEHCVGVDEIWTRGSRRHSDLSAISSQRPLEPHQRQEGLIIVMNACLFVF